MTIIRKKQIEVSIEGVIDYQYANNGNPVVQIADTALVTSYAPSFINHSNGSMLNVPGSNTVHIDSVDALAQGPLRVRPGDVLTITKSALVNNPRLVDWPLVNTETRSGTEQAMAVAFVKYTPIKGQLFPPPIGKSTNPLINFLRSVPITLDKIDFKRLKSIYDYSKVSYIPDIDTLKNVFSDYWLEGYNGWSTDTKTPCLQHPGYGRDVAAWVSKALIYINSTEDEELKKELATNMVEQGLHLAGAFADGRVHQANGGHMQGRKALVVLAGYLLGIPQMTNPNWLGNIFQEDHMHRREKGKTWWFGEWDVFWRRASEFRHPCDMPPSSWTNNEKWAFQGYYWHACGSNLGTAMAMNLMGLKNSIGPDFVDGIQQFMKGPSEETKEELEEAGVKVPWGADYPNTWDNKGIQKLMYDVYGI